MTSTFCCVGQGTDRLSCSANLQPDRICVFMSFAQLAHTRVDSLAFDEVTFQHVWRRWKHVIYTSYWIWNPQGRHYPKLDPGSYPRYQLFQLYCPYLPSLLLFSMYFLWHQVALVFDCLQRFKRRGSQLLMINTCVSNDVANGIFCLLHSLASTQLPLCSCLYSGFTDIIVMFLNIITGQRSDILNSSTRDCKGSWSLQANGSEARWYA